LPKNGEVGVLLGVHGLKESFWSKLGVDESILKSPSKLSPMFGPLLPIVIFDPCLNKNNEDLFCFSLAFLEDLLLVAP